MKINVKTKEKYDIIIQPGLLKRCGLFLGEKFSNSRICIVCDKTVGELFLDEARTALSGFEVWAFVYGGGEKMKTLPTVSRLLEFLAQKGFGRDDLIIALGGGVTGDIAGFAAACYKRHIPYIQMPTTLLAAIDSSVGGKTGVNLEAGKNLCGAIYQPAAVLCDSSIIRSLPKDIFCQGMAEALKYGILFKEDLFSLLEKGYGTVLSELDNVISQCVRLKAAVVEKDEEDNGIRHLLNYGHTAGHAIEALSDYSISHGEAVSMGMCVSSRAAAAHRLCDAEIPERLAEACRLYGLPTETDFSAREIAAAALNDKKIRGEKLYFVFPQSVGVACISEIPTHGFLSFLQGGF